MGKGQSLFLVALFVLGGALLAAAGRGLMKKFEDPPGRIGHGPPLRGLLALAGYLLLLFGLCSVGVGLYMAYLFGSRP